MTSQRIDSSPSDLMVLPTSLVIITGIADEYPGGVNAKESLAFKNVRSVVALASLSGFQVKLQPRLGFTQVGQVRRYPCVPFTSPNCICSIVCCIESSGANGRAFILPTTGPSAVIVIGVGVRSVHFGVGVISVQSVVKHQHAGPLQIAKQGLDISGPYVH